MKNISIKYFLTILVVSLIVLNYQFQITKLQDKIYQLGKHKMLKFKYFFVILERDQKKQFQNNNKVLPEDDLIVVYNRVPKTGSTSFIGVAYDLCKKSKFHVLHVNITANNNVLSLNNQRSFVQNVTHWNFMRPGIYHGHFAYLDFSQFGVAKPLYINLLRKPLDRFISYYYFVRYGDNYRPYLVRKKHGNTMVRTNNCPKLNNLVIICGDMQVFH